MTVNGHKGFTLIEALIALLVLSVGLLSVAAMQLKALQSAHAGYQRTVASLAAQDVVELLWSELNMASNDCPSSADIDLADWAVRWGTILPGVNENPIAGVTTDCVYDIEIRWSDDRFSGETAPVFEYRARLPKGEA